MSSTVGTILITGANGGLGTGFVSQFLESPYAATNHALYCVRDVPSATRLQKILQKSKSSHDVLALDLSSFSTIRATCSSVNNRVQSGALPPLRAVILNAATQHTRAVTYTADGIESNLAVNYLANVLLVLLLLPSLHPARGRVVIVSSWAHDADDWKNRKFITADRFRGRNVDLDLDALADGAKSLAGGTSWSYGKRRYGVSKLLLVMFMFSLQRHLLSQESTSGIRVLAVDPGWMPDTDLARESSLWVRLFYRYVLYPIARVSVHIWPNGLLRTTAKSGRDVLWAALDEGAMGRDRKKGEEEEEGAVYFNGRRIAMAGDRARDRQEQRRIWRQTLQMLGLSEKGQVV